MTCIYMQESKTKSSKKKEKERRNGRNSAMVAEGNIESMQLHTGAVTFGIYVQKFPRDSAALQRQFHALCKLVSDDGLD